MEQTLQQCPIFKGLKAQDIEELLQKYPSRIKNVGEKDFVIQQNDVCDNLMIVVEGLVQAQMVDPSGKLIVIEELGANQLLGPAFLFSEKNAMPVSVFVLQAARVLFIRRQVFLQMLQDNQTVLLNFLSMISGRSHFLTQKLKFHAFLPLKNKVIQYLLEEHSTHQSLRFKLRHTQQELADKFGVARPSLARALAALEKENLVEIRNKEVVIQDLKQMKRLMD